MNHEPAPLSRQQALRLVEGAYLAATTGLIWLALYYLPVGGALFRLSLPLPLALLQLRFGIIPLPQEAYYIDTAPVELSAFDFVLVAAVALALCTFAAYLPARVASRIDPVRSIRFAQ